MLEFVGTLSEVPSPVLSLYLHIRMCVQKYTPRYTVRLSFDTEWIIYLQEIQTGTQIVVWSGLL
jgi:hypothetical protein